jgi:FkbM family methyltransferase
MSRTRALRAWLSGLGLNRGMVVRRMVAIGHPRLRELGERIEASPALRALLAPAGRWLDRGAVVVPAGRAGGLRLSKAHLPLTHAHLGSLAYGDLETSVQEAMRRHLGPGDVFYDIGANLGFFSLLGAVFVQPADGRVYAFEPAPDNAAAIRVNAALNGLGNIEVIEKAVAAAAGPGRLQVVDDQSWSKLAGYGEHPNTEAVIDVELVAVDDLVAAGRIAPPTAVKIDVEGAELETLRGMRRTIAEHRPAIICELHGTHREFAELMRELGYRVQNLEGPEPLERAGASAHALATPVGAAGEGGDRGGP